MSVTVVQDNEDMESEEGQDDSYADVVFAGKRRPDAMILDKPDKPVFVLEFKRTSDQRSDYRERGEARAEKQQKVLVKSLKRASEKVFGPGQWKVKLITLVGGTCGSVNTGV